MQGEGQGLPHSLARCFALPGRRFDGRGEAGPGHEGGDGAGDRGRLVARAAELRPGRELGLLGFLAGER